MMHRRTTIIGAVGLALSLGASQLALAADLDFVPMEPVPPPPVWQPWIEFGGRGSSDLSGAHVRGFVPWALGPNSLFFVQLDGKVLEKDVREGNVALGYRQMMGNGWNFGAWGGYDIHRSRSGKTYDQVSGGIEFLHPNWDFRVNGYLPFDRKRSLGRSNSNNASGEVILSDDQILMLSETITRIRTREERALRGVDGEIGWRLPVGPGERHEVRLYGGGFHFERADSRSMTGPMGRLEWRVNDALPQMPGSRVTFEAGISHDRVRSTVGFAGVNLRIPIGRPPASLAAMDPQSRRMIDPVARQHVVVTRRVATDTTTVTRTEEQVADALTNVRFDRVATVEDGGSITDTSAEAGPNTLIIAEGGTISGPQQLQGDQTLQGGGSTIDVVGLESGTVLPFTAPGSQPTVGYPGNVANLTLLGSNTHVAGLAIHGSGQFSGFGGNDGIFVGSNRRNTFIGQNTISDVGQRGIFIDRGNEVTVYQTDITDTGDRGIRINDDNIVNITDTNVTRAGHDSIDIEGSRNTVSIANTTVTDGADDGIQVEGESNVVTITDVTIANVVDSGIDIGDVGGHTVTITRTAISSTGREGIRIDGDGNTVSIVDTTISDIGAPGSDASGIDILGSNNTLSLLRTDISNVLEDEGVNISGNFNQVSLTDSTISNMIDGDGVDVDGNNNTVALTRVSITDARDTMDVQGAGNDVTITDSTFLRAQRHGIRIESDNAVRLHGSTIAESGDDSIKIRGAFNTVEMTNSEIRDAGDDAIAIDGSDNIVTLTRTSIINPDDNAIDSDNERNVITLNESLISNTGSSAINLRDANFNTLTLEGTIIEDVRRFDGITFFGDNTLILNNSTFRGDFANHGFFSADTTSTLSGDGNTAAEATFGGQFCQVSPQDDGSFVTFDIDTCPPGLAFSDIRLKRDIARLGRLDNGLGLYRYRYLWSDTVYVGVMAQEAEQVMPEAVVRGSDGFLRVDYSRLEVPFMTWDKWTARSPAGPAS